MNVHTFKKISMVTIVCNFNKPNRGMVRAFLSFEIEVLNRSKMTLTIGTHYEKHLTHFETRVLYKCVKIKVKIFVFDTFICLENKCQEVLSSWPLNDTLTLSPQLVGVSNINPFYIFFFVWIKQTKTFKISNFKLINYNGSKKVTTLTYMNRASDHMAKWVGCIPIVGHTGHCM